MTPDPYLAETFCCKAAWLLPGWRCCGCLGWTTSPHGRPASAKPILKCSATSCNGSPSWSPHDQFFSVAHYDKPVFDAAAWRLEIGGLVQQPMALTLDDIRARPAPGGQLHTGVLRQ